MFCKAKGDEDEDLEKKLELNGGNGDYVRLECNSNDVVVVPRMHGEFMHRNPRYWEFIWWWWWGKVIVSGILVGALVLVVIKWVGPFLVNKVCCFIFFSFLICFDNVAFEKHGKYFSKMLPTYLDSVCHFIC